MSGWLLAPLFLLLYVGIGVWQGRRADLPKQRVKFGRHILRADAELKPLGFVFKDYTLKHGIIFGRGKAFWTHEDGRTAEIDQRRL